MHTTYAALLHHPPPHRRHTTSNPHPTHLPPRFERRTYADPFEVYRALRVVNPSPYMVYMQCRGCIMVASSPEILCRVDSHRVVTNRPLAGTRRR